MAPRQPASPCAEPQQPRRKTAGMFHHGDLRAALVAATAQAVERVGERVLLRELADRLGVTQPSVYRHFASKEALLLEVALDGYLGLIQASVRASDGLEDPFDIVAAVSRAYVRYAHQRPGWFRLAHTRARTEPLVHAALARTDVDAGFASDPLRAALVRVVGRDAAELDDVYRALWGLAHGLSGLVVERVFQRVQTDDERLQAADAAIDLIVDLLRFRYPA